MPEVFFEATSLVIEYLYKIYKEGDNLIIPRELYNGLDKLYPKKDEEEYKLIISDLRNKYKINGKIYVR
tara:strand:+ start:1941 stop:2147 length:207 start_codon:yes stop_codon:yes gene_type:complete